MTSHRHNSQALVLVEVLGLAALALLVLRGLAIVVSLDAVAGQFAAPLENGLTTSIGLVGLGILYIAIFHRDAVTESIQFDWLTTNQLLFLWKLLLVTWVLAGVTSYLLLLIDGGSTGNSNAEYATQSVRTVLASTAVSMAIIGPIEEFFYRGVIQTRVQSFFTPRVAIGVASIVFAASHIMTVQGSPLGQSVYYALLFCIGVVHGYAYYKTETIVAPMLLHGLYNASITVLAFM